MKSKAIFFMNALRYGAVSKTVVVIIIAVVIIAFSLVVAYFAGSLRMTRGNVKLIGECRNTTYLLPDTVQLIFSNVTITQNGTISYSQSVVSSIPASTQTLGVSTYSIQTYARNSTSYVVTNTTEQNQYSPSASWIVSTCTFAPP